jgi:hypothetical protein
MNCEETRAALGSFLGGKLIGEQSRSIRLHLAGCADCASTLSKLDRMEILPAIDEEIEPPPHLAAQFRARLEEHRSRTAKNHSGFSFFRWYSKWGWRNQLAAAMGLVVLLAAGVFWNRYMTMQRGSTISEISVAENLPLLRDMAVIENLDLLEDFENIQDLSQLPTNVPER